MQNYTNATTLRKRIGSAVYVTQLYVKNDAAAESVQDKIIRLIKNELNCSQKIGIIKPLQAGWLSERSSS